MNPSSCDRVWAGVAVPAARRHGRARLSFGLGGLFGVDLIEGDGVAERFELSLEAAGSVLNRVAFALPVGSEVSGWDLVADDVVVGDEQVVADRADCFGFAASSA